MLNQSFIPLKSLSSHFLEPIACYHLPFTSRFRMHAHRHPQYEIMYCEQGAFTVECYDDNGTLITTAHLAEKSFILLNNTSFHKLIIDTEDATLMNLEFLPVKDLPKNSKPLLKKVTLSAEELFLENPQLGDLLQKNEPFYVFHDSQEVNYTLRKLIHSLLERDSLKVNFSIRLLITELFIDISHCWLDETTAPPVLTYVKKALLYIQHNFNKPLTVSSIAKTIGISPTYLQKLFQAEFGESVHTTITKIRIEKAKKLLRDTTFTNTDIAKLTGFGTRTKLISAIKNSENCTPRDFRQSVLQKQWATKKAPAIIIENTIELNTTDLF